MFGVLRALSVLRRPGDDLLSRGLSHSTIGAEEFNGRVRDGIGFYAPRSGHRAGEGQIARIGFWFWSWTSWCSSVRGVRAGIMGGDQADRAISTGKLNALLRLHARPIDVVVYHGSRGRSRFEVGFPLRCLQRLSRPHIATLHRGWRHDRSTRGASIPVLSY